MSQDALSQPSSATPQAVAPTPKGAPIMTTSSVIKLCLLVSLLSSAASLALYDRYFAQKVVAVDIKTFLEDKKAEMIAGQLDAEGMKKELDKLEAVVAAIPKNKAVLMGDLVVKNVEVIKP